MFLHDCVAPGLLESNEDPSLFVHTIVCDWDLYVDDKILTCDDAVGIQFVKHLLFWKFQIKNLGVTLLAQISLKTLKVWFSEQKYFYDILDRLIS